MKTKVILIISLFASFVNGLAQTNGEQKAYKIDKGHSNVSFKISHFVISDVKGSFKEFSGNLKYAKADFSDAKINLTIESNSIETNDATRDNHLKTADFFDVSKYPTITFQSTTFKVAKNKTVTIKGNLTVNGITKPILLNGFYKGEFINPTTKSTIAVFQISGDIIRKDFNIGTTYPAAALGEVVKLESTIELVKG